MITAPGDADAARDPAPSPAFAPPPGEPRFPLFDGLRGLAVLGILAFHVTELTGRIGFGLGGRLAEVAGGEAVIVFFAISGFLLYRPFSAARAGGRAAPGVPRYLRNRALRILPGYWVALSVLAAWPGIVGVATGDWWRLYGYLQLYSPRTEGLGIPVAWTLCVEVTYYLALPVWAAAVRRLPRGLAGELVPLAAVAAGGFAVQILAARHAVSATLGITLAGQCAWIAVGMAVAALTVHRRGWLDRAGGRPLACWAGAALAAAILAALVPSGGLFGLIAAVNVRQALPATLAKLAAETALVTLLLIPALAPADGPGLPRRILAARPVVGLGVVSYSFYLYHLTVAQLIALGHAPGAFRQDGLGLLAHLHTARSPVLYVLTLAATGAVAAASYRWVELPFLRRKAGRERRPMLGRR